MGPYEETRIEQEPINVRVYKRPGMYFLDVDDGTGYAIIVQELVDTVLSWKPGANVTVTLGADRVVVACRARLPDAPLAWTWDLRKPFRVPGEGMASLGASWFTSPMDAHAVVCRDAVWELRDGGEEQFALFDEGICRQAGFAAPELPGSLCFRVALRIGTARLPFAPATLGQVAERIRYLGGPAEAGYWGCVTLRDERTGETRAIVVTDPPPRPPWRAA